MDYKINWDCSEGVFAVPDAAAEGLKLASGKAVKVLIYFMKYRRQPEVPEDIGVSAEDVEDALSYWEQLGVLKKADDAVSSAQKPVGEVSKAAESVRIIAQPPEPASAAAAEKPVIKPRKALLPTEIAERIAASEEIDFLFKSAEQSLGRVLTFDDQRTILWFYDHLGMSADIIIMLIACCCSVGRGNMGKIEKVALDWHEKNITTHEQAENEMLALQKAFSFEGKVQSRLKLQSKLTASQKKYIGDWANMDVTVDMVELAYDKTVDSIGKVSFNYMDKILRKWHENGITNAEDAAAFDERTKPVRKTEKKPAAAEAKPSAAPSYDLDLLFEHALKSTPTVKKINEEAR
ncbi:MAG: DnaD domain protein [Huintestinicola sp.]|uniref:DnaD domain protein n=1 Tax=Huintestinicola sp. TaxID=2981661 RepID=UPI003F0F7F24